MIEKTIIRADVFAKATGAAQYADDLLFDGMLYVKTVMSSKSHAKIESIDTSEALAVPGIVAVLTAKDVPGKLSNPTERPILTLDTVRYIGDGVAIVIAESLEAAKQGMKKVKVNYLELPAVYEVEDALAEGAPAIHGTSNEVCHWKVRKGNIADGFAEADVIVEEDFTTQRVYHGHMETEICIAEPTPQGVNIYCPGKAPFFARQPVADALNIGLNQVRAVQPVVGGSFGAKGTDAGIIAARASVAAKHTGRVCKIIYNREESMVECTKRHPFKLRYKVGAKKDGTITAMEIYGLADAGAYTSETKRTTARSCVEATGPYAIPNVKTDIIGVYTNTVSNDAMRGYGSPQVDACSEQIMDELAVKLEMDPILLRRKNGLKEGSLSATGQVMTGVSLDECIDKLVERFDWYGRKERIAKENKNGDKVRGLGMACMYRGEAMGAGAIDTAGVNVHVEKDGSVKIYAGLNEVGQGGHAMLASVACLVLGISDKRISIARVDSAYVPDSGPTVASRGTVLAGNACQRAAEQIKEKLALTVAETFKVKPEDLSFANEQIFITANPEMSMSFEKAVAACYNTGQNVYGFGWWCAPYSWIDPEGGSCEPYFSYVYGACATEVEVDLVTGKTEVLAFAAAHDVGHALNVMEVENQIRGGVSMGIGYALTEEILMIDGRVDNPNFRWYITPTAVDYGEIIPIVVEMPSEHGPLGAKGLGEPATSIVAPTILNAIRDAIGTRIYQMPASLENVAMAIAANKGGKA